MKEVELLCFTELRDLVEQEIEEATAAGAAVVVASIVVGIAQLKVILLLTLASEQKVE